ncbi:putative polygalacturonase [Drosera capensis]
MEYESGRSSVFCGNGVTKQPIVHSAGSATAFRLSLQRTKRGLKDTSNWLLVDPLPSYGRGREIPGGRYASFILGNGVHDVVITDENGTIDGQGVVWWDMWRGKTLQHTRPHLLELMYSKQILISNVIFKDSPFWNIHPVYCR